MNIHLSVADQAFIVLYADDLRVCHTKERARNLRLLATLHTNAPVLPPVRAMRAHMCSAESFEHASAVSSCTKNLDGTAASCCTTIDAMAVPAGRDCRCSALGPLPSPHKLLLTAMVYSVTCRFSRRSQLRSWHPILWQCARNVKA